MRTPLVLGLAALLVFPLAATFLAHHYADLFIEDQEGLVHTHVVLAEVAGTFTRVRDAESSVRGFIVTGEDAFLDAFRKQRPEILAEAAKLRELTLDNPAQLARIDRLAGALEARVDKLDELVRARREEGIAAAGLRVTQGRPLSEAIRAILQEMEDEERRLLKTRVRESGRSAIRMKASFLALAAAGGAVLVILFLVVNRYREFRRRAERQIDQFFSSSLDLLGIANLADGKFARVSDSWEKTLGWTTAELTSTPWIDFIHPEDRVATIEAGGRLVQGDAVISFENRYRCRDGSYRWLSWKVPAPYPGASVVYAVARDVTDLKRIQQELVDLSADRKRRMEETLAANKELEAFSYSVSHDLRAPLRAIDGFSRLLHEDFGPQVGEEGNRLISVVRSNTQRMGQLIDDLLKFSRLGRKELDKSQVSMEDLFRDCLEEIRRDDPARVVEVRVEPLPAVHGDRSLLRQVWTNLLSNAWKYSRPKSDARVEIGAERKSGEVVFHVRDNGVGFDMKYADKLFGVFQRLHSKREFDGTGVGLAIVQRVVQRHNGRVWAESRLGEGAVFYFAIPE